MSLLWGRKFGRGKEDDGKIMGKMREKVNFVEMKKNETKEKLLMIRKKIECLELIRKEEERKHL